MNTAKRINITGINCKEIFRYTLHNTILVIERNKEIDTTKFIKQLIMENYLYNRKQ